MTLRTIIIGILALTFGGSAAIGVNMLYHQQSAPPAETVAVVVAARDIPRGTMLGHDYVTTREFPKEFAPAGAVEKISDALDRVAFHSIVKDEPVLTRMLSEKHAKGGLAGLIPKGMRAFTIQTPHVASHVAGFILPGNKVDVLLTMTGQGGPGDSTGGGITTTLLQSVEVLAVDQRLEAPSENKVDPRNLQSVTLLVTPDQAAKLELGQNKGTLHLTLRNPDDTQDAKAQPATLNNLQFYQEKPWSEQAKDIIAAIAKLRTPTQPTKQSPSVPDPSTSKSTVLEIRTVRGTFSGVVPVEQVRPTSGR